jgi:hypothetical protein
VLLIFFLVFGVLSFAVSSVVGVVFALALGQSAATFLTTVVSALVGAGFGIVLATFTAQLYRLLTGAEAAETFG